MTEVTQTSQRKADHIRINLEEDVDFPTVTTGLENYRFIHQAVPELDLEEIDTTTHVFDMEIAVPLLISSMTGGTQRAHELNLRLAAAAQKHGMAMGLGSQRAMIEQPDSAHTFEVRSVAPDIPLFANLGAVQLNYGYGVEECQAAVEMVRADALILHLNVLQEAVQPEGDTRWGGLLEKIAEVTAALDVPVIAKEVGWGISGGAAMRLIDAGVAAIDVAGAGGTSWSQVEYYRAPSAFHAQVAKAFADWGIPTEKSIRMVRQEAPENFHIFASGGLRTGIDVAKCISLGADLGGMAGPFLRAADQGEDALDEAIRVIIAQLKITMMCTGVADIAELKETPVLPINV